MKHLYDSINGLDCHAVAIVDDIYFFGPPGPAFIAANRFDTSLGTNNTGLTINRKKNLALIPNDRKIKDLCDKHQIRYDTKLLPALGGVIGRKRADIMKWLKNRWQKMHKSLFDNILDPALPS